MRRFSFKLADVAIVLFVLLVISFVIWRLILAHEINSQLAAIRASGLPANGQEANDYYPAVPDDQNAAVKMAVAFGLMTNYNDRRLHEVDSILFPGRKDSLTSMQMELIASYCAINSNALAQAQEAIKLPRSRYPIDLSWGAATLLPHLAKLKTLSRAAAFQTVLDPNDSATAIATILGMVHTLDNEPVVISKLVRVALVYMAVAIMERRLNSGEFDAKEIIDLKQLLASVDQTNQLANGFIGERATYIRYFRMSYAEMKKLADSDTDDQSSSGQEGPPLPGPQPLIYMLTGFFERDLRFYLQSMQTYIYLAQSYPKNISAITNADTQIREASRANFYILSSMFLPALGSTIYKEASEVASVRTAEVALAVEGFRGANGRLPENLNELVPQFLPSIPEDPFDGKPLRYHLLAKGYVVYSVGRDGHDNGGRERPARIKSSDKTEYDVTFTVER